MIQRFPLASLPTPLQPMTSLGRHLGFRDGMLWVKRDDLTGLAGGGNKVRKLEYLCADALARGCQTLVTGGAPQSNHVRTAAAAARVAGLDCVAVLGGEHTNATDGNLVLDRLFGAELVWAGRYDAEHLETVLAETCLRLSSEGRKPYEVPLGGASEIGALGYVSAAHEIASHAPLGALVYTATGTGGTQAGLAVGLGHHDRVRGVDVGAVPDVATRIESLVVGTASLVRRPFPAGSVVLDRSRIGTGYGDPDDVVREAIRLAARHEALLVDPVYSGKALAALIADRSAGDLSGNQPVVFLHTGGLPSVFADRYRDWLVA